MQIFSIWHVEVCVLFWKTVARCMHAATAFFAICAAMRVMWHVGILFNAHHGQKPHDEICC